MFDFKIKKIQKEKKYFCNYGRPDRDDTCLNVGYHKIDDKRFCKIHFNLIRETLKNVDLELEEVKND